MVKSVISSRLRFEKLAFPALMKVYSSSQTLTHYTDQSRKQSTKHFSPQPTHGSMQLFFTFPLSLQHFQFVCQYVCEMVVKALFRQLPFNSRRANDLWS